MRPSQLSRQRRDNLRIGEDRGELDHAPEVLLSEPAPVAGLQLSPHCGDDLRAVLRAPPVENLGLYTVPHLPVQRRERGVRGGRHLFASHLDHRPELAHERRHLELAGLARCSRECLLGVLGQRPRRLSRHCRDFLPAALCGLLARALRRHASRPRSRASAGARFDSRRTLWPPAIEASLSSAPRMAANLSRPARRVDPSTRVSQQPARRTRNGATDWKKTCARPSLRPPRRLRVLHRPRPRALRPVPARRRSGRAVR